MRSIIYAIGTLLVVISCAPSARFPVSGITPDATILVNTKKDRYKNSLIFIRANKLETARVIDSSKNVYVVWIETPSNGTKNIGSLKLRRQHKASLRTITPFEPRSIFITAENSEFITRPSGVEISRLSVDEAMSQN